MTARIRILAHVPDDLAHLLMQHLRDFDTAHPGCHFDIAVDSTTATVAEARKILDVSPPLASRLVLTKDMVNAAVEEWKRDNPGQDFASVDPKDFGQRLADKIAASASVVHEPHPRKQ